MFWIFVQIAALYIAFRIAAIFMSISNSLWLNDKSFAINLLTICKFCIAYCIVYIRNKGSFKKHTLRKPLAKYAEGLLSSEREWKLECPLLADSNDDDEINFQGSDSSGNILMVRIVRHKMFSELHLILKYDHHVYTLPEHPNTRTIKFCHESDTYISKGVRLFIGDPFRGWRISVNTYLRRGICTEQSTDERNLVHVKFAGSWHSVTEVYNFACDQSPSLIARSLAVNKWSSNLVKSLYKQKQTLRTNQWGQLISQICVGSDVSNQDFYLHCLKNRSFGVSNANSVDRFVTNGSFLYLSICDESVYKNVMSGYLIWPSGEIFNVSKWEALKSSDNFFAKVATCEQFVSKFTANDTPFILRVTVDHRIPLNVGEINANVDLKLCAFNLNGKDGFGIISFGQQRQTQSIDSSDSLSNAQRHKPYLCTAEEMNTLVVPLKDQLAQCTALSGGKGCNLATIIALQNKFVVPNGICITTAAYKRQVERIDELKHLFIIFENYGRLSDSELQSKCIKITETFMKHELDDVLKDSIENVLVGQFGLNWNKKLFAVRSSALGEDSSDLSTAGQLETYLNVDGFENICVSIQKCWASQFHPEAVQYLRQHGQSLTQPVAVVIQEMVQTDVSGVLFTNDPVSEDPLRMVINAHPGLGELVVSGAVTPDTVVIKRSYFTNSCNVENFELGEPELRGACCIDDQTALKLASIGLELEAYFGYPKDVEWGIKDDILYIFQSRDITSLMMESDFEILHEFDCAITSEEDVYTTANVGEVMAFPTCPLTVCVSGFAVEKGSQYQRALAEGLSYMRHNHTYHLGITHRNRVFLNALSCMYQDMAYFKDTRLIEVVVMGHILEDERVKKFARNRYAKPPMSVAAYRTFGMFKILLYDLHVLLKPFTKRYENYTLQPLANSCEGLYTQITSHFNDLCDVWYLHLLSSIRTSFSYTVVAGSILPSNQEWSADHFSDISLLYSSCSNVISADVPAALKKISRLIVTEEKAAEFRSLEPEDALLWLRNNTSKTISQSFDDFLLKHGHRTITEIDLRAKSWAMDPRPLVAVLQNMMKDENALWRDNEEIPIDEAIRRLHQPINFGKRWFLQKMVPMARSAVAAREQTKNLGVKVVDAFRHAFVRLGEMLCAKGYLPDVDLIFFLMPTEIEKLMKFRSAKVVAKALRRRKLFPLQSEVHYPEIMIGQPKPIEELVDYAKYLVSDIVIKGTPVSKGIAKGRARVACRLEDAKETKPGEILVARSTDIGWSPYFPLLSGVVTELGGLLSHGAVVAREYGLPCIVGAQQATSLIRTGDMVILDAGKGILRKVLEE